MSRSLDLHEDFQNAQARARHEASLAQGVYLGFFIPGSTVVLRHVPDGAQKEAAPKLVSCSIARLFE